MGIKSSKKRKANNSDTHEKNFDFTVVKETQIKITLRCHFLPMEIAKIQKADILSWQN